jgi:hypothetical protein
MWCPAPSTLPAEPWTGWRQRRLTCTFRKLKSAKSDRGATAGNQPPVFHAGTRPGSDFRRAGQAAAKQPATRSMAPTRSRWPMRQRTCAATRVGAVRATACSVSGLPVRHPPATESALRSRSVSSASSSTRTRGGTRRPEGTTALMGMGAGCSFGNTGTRSPRANSSCTM